MNRVIGERVRALRQAAGLTQEELAAALDEAPAVPAAWRHRQTVSFAEQGARQFSAEDLVGLALFFGVPVVFLLAPPERRGRDGKWAFAAAQISTARAWLDSHELADFVDAQLVPASNTDGVLPLDKSLHQWFMERLAGPDRVRPWARELRDGEGGPGLAYLRARHGHLDKTNRRLPGPTVSLTAAFYAEDDVEWGFDLPPWKGVGVKLTGMFDETFTAKDDLEAEFFRRLIDRGLAKRTRARKAAPKNVPKKGKGKP